MGETERQIKSWFHRGYSMVMVYAETDFSYIFFGIDLKSLSIIPLSRFGIMV